MRWRRFAGSVVAFGALVTLHYTLRPLLGWRAAPDFLVIAVLLMAVRVRPGAAALIGFVTGIVADSLTPTSFGAGALGMTVIGFAASWLKAVFFADNVLLHASFFFAGKMAHDFLYVIADRPESVGQFLIQVLIWSPLSAVVTALAGVLLMMLFRATLEPRTA